MSLRSFPGCPLDYYTPTEDPEQWGLVHLDLVLVLRRLFLKVRKAIDKRPRTGAGR